MFTTVEEVEKLTGYTIDPEVIEQAQAMIESYVGRLEIEVTNASDQLMLARATAYQAVYMLSTDAGMIFGQVRTAQTMMYGNMMTFFNDGVSPFIAPLAVIACRHLSWNRMRSVKTGSIYATPPVTDDGWKTL